MQHKHTSVSLLYTEALRPFLWVAWLGVATTAVNIALPMFAGAAEPKAAQALRALRQPVLFVHALATLLPMLALAMLGWRYSPFAAVVAVTLTGIEKMTELIGQMLVLFPTQEEALPAVWPPLRRGWPAPAPLC